MAGNLDRVPALALVLDYNRHRVTRGDGPFVELGRNVWRWKLFVALCRRYEGYYRPSNLIADALAPCSAEIGTLYRVICDLRKRLRPLEITIKHRKDSGVRLEDMRVRTTC